MLSHTKQNNRINYITTHFTLISAGYIPWKLLIRVITINKL